MISKMQTVRTINRFRNGPRLCRHRRTIECFARVVSVVTLEAQPLSVFCRRSMSQLGPFRRSRRDKIMSEIGCRLNRSTQHFILDEKMECIQ